MLEALVNDFNCFCNIEVCPQNEAVIRNGAHEMMLAASCIDRNKLTSDEICMLSCIAHSCHSRLRKLNNTLICRKRKCDFQLCCVNELITCVIGACRTAVDGTGKIINLMLPEKDISLSLCPRLTVWALLNAVSNSLLYCKSEEIVVGLRPLTRGVMICVKSKTDIGLDDIDIFTTVKDSGLKAICSAAKLHKGRVLFSRSGKILSVNLFIPYGLKSDGCYTPPDVIDLIYDKFSPVYIALCDCVFPPI